MAEVVKGKLVWDAAKKVRKVVFPTKKGASIPTPFDAGDLANVLRAEKADEVEVDLEVAQGKPKRIRPVGQPWQVAAPLLPVAARAVGPPQPRPQPAPVTHTRPPSDFVNPYNFAPAVKRDGVHGDLGDGKPVGHDRLHDGRYTGTIRVTLTTKTPLLIPDAARMTEAANGHKTFPLRVDAAGNPYLPPTTVKGMLRAAYEAATNSRLGVFAGHDDRLAFRRQAKVDVEPAFVEAADDGAVRLRVLWYRPMNSPPKLARYQQRSRGRNKGESAAATRYPDGALPAHGDDVWVRLQPNGRAAEILRRGDSPAGRDWRPGRVMITGANINNKKSERVFVFSDDDDEAVSLTGPEAARVRALWAELIRDYQSIHERELAQREAQGQRPSDYLGNEPGRTAWSRHVYTPADRELTAGALVYIRRDPRSGQILGVYPVSISRQLFDASPLDSLHPSLRPATALDQLSPADRVFGWVNQNGNGAFRGQLRVGPVRMTLKPDAVSHFPDPGLPLAILGQPKPQQSRFYLGDATGNAQPDRHDKEQAGYDGVKQLRGRKVYPHHADLPADHWNWSPQADAVATSDPNRFREYLRHPQDPTRRDNQNRSILGWVNPETTFTFDLHVVNLSAVELGAFAWLLALPDGGCHRLGLGKPLGFGSIRLDINPEETKVYAAAGWKEIYGTLDDVTPEKVDVAELAAGFETALREAYDERAETILGSLRASGRGISGKPTHYPRTVRDPNPAGEGYEWFVANDRGGQLALPNLTDADPGLPGDPR